MQIIWHRTYTRQRYHSQGSSVVFPPHMHVLPPGGDLHQASRELSTCLRATVCAVASGLGLHLTLRHLRNLSAASTLTSIIIRQIRQFIFSSSIYNMLYAIQWCSYACVNCHCYFCVFITIPSLHASDLLKKWHSHIIPLLRQLFRNTLPTFVRVPEKCIKKI